MEESKLDTEAIAAAVDWWVNAMDRGAKQDNGELVQSAMMKFLAVQVGPPAPEQMQRFREKLTEILMDGAPRGDTAWWPDKKTLSVDYGPAGALREAGEYADLDSIHFPVKTVMWIKPDSVRVKHGYGAPIQTIWGKEMD